MAQRVLRIGNDATLKLDDAEITLSEFEAVLAEEHSQGITEPFKVYAPVMADPQIMTAILEFSDKYRPSEIVMGNVE